jgi:5'-phosphate synthase pdxT subunit
VGREPIVGVLALQGDVREHSQALADLGIRPIEVRSAADLAGIEAIVLPGGESTTLWLLLGSSGLREPLRERLAGGMPALGTCAGMILLASSVSGGREGQGCLGAIDISVRRNAFGRQVDSFEDDIAVDGFGTPFHAVFIRAPLVERVGPGVEVMAEVKGRDGVCRPVACRQGPVLVTAFHPELSGDSRVHRELLKLI